MDVFMLYKRVQNKDRDDEIELIKLHKAKYPNHSFHTLGIKRGYSSDYRNIFI